jgi:hypothetical protein
MFIFDCEDSIIMGAEDRFGTVANACKRLIFHHRDTEGTEKAELVFLCALCVLCGEKKYAGYSARRAVMGSAAVARRAGT